MKEQFNYIINHTKWCIIVSCCILFILGIIDWITGYELSFQFFYFIPLTIFASNIKFNKIELILFAFITSGVWFLADYYNNHIYSYTFLYAWNTMSRLIIFTIFALFLNSIVRHRRKIESLNTELLKKDSIVTDSIKYAKTIQDAIIPSFKNFNTIFPHSFIVNKPKNILSGDFFWYHKQDNLIYFAIVDCTGHGVPGSLLSIIGNILIQKVIIGKELSSPDEILKNLHQEIENIFNSGNIVIDDGLEIGLVVFDETQKELCISQTTQSILVVNPDGEITVPESNGFTIGGLLSKRRGPHYTSQTIKIDKGSWLYLFSDGYADQFGSVENIKFGFDNLSNLIKNMKADSTANEQSYILTDTINKWKGGRQQTDDIMIAGIGF